MSSLHRVSLTKITCKTEYLGREVWLSLNLELCGLNLPANLQVAYRKYHWDILCGKQDLQQRFLAKNVLEGTYIIQVEKIDIMFTRALNTPNLKITTKTTSSHRLHISDLNVLGSHRLYISDLNVLGPV